MVEKKKTIAENMAELDLLLEWFESDEVTIEDAVKKYEQALALAATLEEELKNAQNQIEVIKKKFS